MTLHASASLRHDDVTNKWVAVAPHRRATPFDAEHGVRVTRDRSTCPFCPGHEDRTTPVSSVRVGVDGKWQVRAFENLFPSLFQDAPTPEPTSGGAVRRAYGIHEVVVETPDHDADLSDVSDEHAVAVLDLYRERLRVAAALPHIRAALLFKNRGPRAGASLVHPHGQIVALPITPPGMRRRDRISRRTHRLTGQGSVALCRDREIAAGVRVVERTGHFVAYCPFASQRTMETWIVPMFREPSLTATSDNVLGELGALITRTLRRVQRATRGADYNLVLRTPALRWMNEPWAQWHMEILPRLGGDAGFEIASEMYCTSGLPEESAAILRAAV